MSDRMLMRCVFGSHLYGTATPNSDADFKGVFLPSQRDVILQRVPKAISQSTGDKKGKNQPGDVDVEVFSLHGFLRLAGEGQTVAIDMLHVPDACLLETSEEWEFVRAHRQRFYSRDMRAFVGYCRTQAAKYGVKGGRVAACREVVERLKVLLKTDAITLGDVWEALPVGEHIRKFEDFDSRQADKRMYEVCGRKMPATASIHYALSVFETFLTKYGERARQAERNEGVDWKAISHAFRAGFQAREILLTRDLRFPLAEREFLTRVKVGEFHFKNDGIAEKLDAIVEEVLALCEVSGLPEKVDMAWWDELLVAIYVDGDVRVLEGLAR